MEITVKVERLIGGKKSFENTLVFQSKKDLDKAVNKACKRWFKVYGDDACVMRDESVEVGSIVTELYKYGCQFETYETWTVDDVKVSYIDAWRHPEMIADTLDKVKSFNELKTWSRKIVDEARKQHQRIPWPEISGALFDRLECMSDKQIVKYIIED